jgi:hypothetical protein
MELWFEGNIVNKTRIMLSIFIDFKYHDANTSLLFSDGSLLDLLYLTLVWMIRFYIVFSLAYLALQTNAMRNFYMKISGVYIPPLMQLFHPKMQLVLKILYDRRLPFLLHLKVFSQELKVFSKYIEWKHNLRELPVKVLPLPIWEKVGWSLKRGNVRFDEKQDQLCISKKWSGTVTEYAASSGTSPCLDSYLENNLDDILAHEAYGKTVHHFKNIIPEFPISQAYLTNANTDLAQENVLLAKSINTSSPEHFDMQHPKTGLLKSVYLDKRGTVFGENRLALHIFKKNISKNETGIIGRTNFPRADVLSVKWSHILTNEQLMFLNNELLQDKLDIEPIKAIEQKLNLAPGIINISDITILTKPKKYFSTENTYLEGLKVQVKETKLKLLCQRGPLLFKDNPITTFTIDGHSNNMFSAKEAEFATIFIQNSINEDIELRSMGLGTLFKIQFTGHRLPHQPDDWVNFALSFENSLDTLN